MKMLEFLKDGAITADLKSNDKEGVISELVDLLFKDEDFKGKDKLVKALMDREALGSTGIGQGIGIPHAKSSVVNELQASLGISRKGVDYDSLDGEPTYIFFLLVAPEDAAGPHLKALARISRVLKDKFVRDSLISAKDEKAVLNIISQVDEKSQ
jgi:PTS system nitrogen regulatory IIA component